MELFRRNSKVQRHVIINSDVIHEYLGYNIVSVQKNLLSFYY
jgi:hypothetical protein